MLNSRIARNVVGFFGLALLGAALAPVQAGEPPACDMIKANSFIAAGERFDAHRQYVEATRQFLAAGRSTRDCRTAAGVLIGSRSLAKAGSALAQRGEYLDALSLLRAAQVRLAPVAASDERQSASAARALADLVQNLISAIDGVGRSTM